MELSVAPLAVLVDKLEGVAVVRVHEPGTVGDTTVTKEVDDLVT